MNIVLRNALAGVAVVATSVLLARRRRRDVTQDRSHASRTVTIRADAGSLLENFSDPVMLPRFFHALHDAMVLDATHQRWTFVRGSQRSRPIDIEIVDHIPGKRLTWQTTNGGSYSGGGSVTVTAAPECRGTQVRLALHVDGPGAKPLAAFERLFGTSPAQLAVESLRNLKALAEAGERPTAARA